MSILHVRLVIPHALVVLGAFGVLGSVDLPLVTHLLERGQLPLWHLVLDPHAVPSARSRRPTRFAQTPLTQMAGQDLRHSEATGVQLHLSDVCIRFGLT